jgi:superfamily I DNA/RNA helicase
MVVDLKNKLNQSAQKYIERGILDYEEQLPYQEEKDKHDILSFLSKKVVDLQQLNNKLTEIFCDKVDGIVLSTVHKMKGLEANRVFIIKPDLLPMKTKNALQYQEEKNLFYVAITRAKTELIYDVEWDECTIITENKDEKK